MGTTGTSVKSDSHRLNDEERNELRNVVWMSMWFSVRDFPNSVLDVLSVWIPSHSSSVPSRDLFRFRLHRAQSIKLPTNGYSVWTAIAQLKGWIRRSTLNFNLNESGGCESEVQKPKIEVPRIDFNWLANNRTGGCGNLFTQDQNASPWVAFAILFSKKMGFLSHSPFSMDITWNASEQWPMQNCCSKQRRANHLLNKHKKELGEGGRKIENRILLMEYVDVGTYATVAGRINIHDSRTIT